MKNSDEWRREEGSLEEGSLKYNKQNKYMRFQLPSPLEIHRIRRFLKKNKKKEAKGLGVRKQDGKYISRLLMYIYNDKKQNILILNMIIFLIT